MISKRFGEVLRFGVVGCIAVAVQYAIYYLLLGIFPHSISYSFGYIISFLVNYYLTTSFTFKTKKSKRNGVGFAISHIINYCMQVILLNLFIYLGCSKQLAPIPVFAICVPSNFVLVRYFMKRF